MVLEEKLALLEAESEQKSISPPTHLRPNLGTPYVAPRNEMELAIANIWQELLGIEEVGVHDDFFELGGHSLLAVRITSRLRGVFQQDLPLNCLFETPTVAGLAAMSAPFQTSGDPVVEAIATAIDPSLDKPFALFRSQYGSVARLRVSTTPARW